MSFSWFRDLDLEKRPDSTLQPRRASKGGDDTSTAPLEDTAGEQLVLALRSLHRHLNSEAGQNAASLSVTPQPTVARMSPYPRLNFSEIEQGRRLLGGLAGGEGQKTRLEQEIHQATSKVYPCLSDP